jgi:chloramphenicol 3-O phosphotransferase
VGDTFRAAEQAWYEGLAAIVRAGTGVIVDEVFLQGGASQARLERALQGLSVLWVGVRCDPIVAEKRERQRSDRTIGMARKQAATVHQGVHYDIVVDTSHLTPDQCALEIVTWLAGHDPLRRA